MTTELLDPFGRLLEETCSPAQVRAMETSGDESVLWSALEESGFLDALVPEDAGGAGLSLGEIGPLIMALGAHAAPAAIAETMAARALLAQAGADIPRGPIPLASPGPEVRPLAAVLRAALIAGAGGKVLAMSVAYANDRVQFGKPIGKQQAIQQQLAVMAEQSVAARLAAQIGLASGLNPPPEAAATAKLMASLAATDIANIAHAVHGAIGISEEFDLQLYTRRLRQWRLDEGAEGYWSERLGRARLQSGVASSVDYVRTALSGAVQGPL
jgi:acyl-CoA dehydrogenase